MVAGSDAEVFAAGDRPADLTTKAFAADIDSDDGFAFKEDLAARGPAVGTGSLATAAELPWRAALALKKLRKQIDDAFPGRSLASDGFIGDANHCPGTSDHCAHINDGGVGVVSAVDITDDVAHGCKCQDIVDAVAASRDSRIKYIIWNERIANSSSIGGAEPWAWRDYDGSNPHTGHAHFSVLADKTKYDDESAWSIATAAPNA